MEKIGDKADGPSIAKIKYAMSQMPDDAKEFRKLNLLEVQIAEKDRLGKTSMTFMLNTMKDCAESLMSKHESQSLPAASASMKPDDDK